MSILETSVRRLTDKRIYEDELAEWLPAQIIDCHVHVGLDRHCGPVSPERLRRDWAMRLGLDQSWSQLRENYRVLFPDKLVTAMAFGNVYREVYTDQNNSYVHEGIGNEDICAAGLFVTRPEDSAEKVARALASGFAGIKPYPDLAPQGCEEARIADFLPDHHLAELDRAGGVLTLHLPRPGRLADEHNIRDLIRISEQYPRVAIIVAHVGRAYCLSTALEGLPHFADRDSIYFDVAANLNREVFRVALETVGPERLLFGSDLPVTMVRGVREHNCDGYVNYLEVPHPSGADHEGSEEEAGYTFLVYEELRALVRAVKQTGLGKEAMEKMLFSNCAGLLGRVGGRASVAGVETAPLL